PAQCNALTDTPPSACTGRPLCHNRPMSVADSLATFVDHYLKSSVELVTPYDASWRSPCESGDPFNRPDQAGELIHWRPVARHGVDDFRGLEAALDIEVHPDIKAYFGGFWSAGLEACAPEGQVSLILLWNPEDADRLVENLIGHALAQRQAHAPFSVFFACTQPQSELFLSVRNDTGQVILEQPGRTPLRVVSETLAQFIDCLTPAPNGP
ncbi:MAG: SecY-interacting protein Syd, partial [Proteobacteria bacterium]|nr:SecY-interacting protein Syd [Pseudomonadota bacterium]